MLTGTVTWVIAALLWPGHGQTPARRLPMEMQMMQGPFVEVNIQLPPGTYVHSDNPPCGPWFDGPRLPPEVRERARREFRGEATRFLDLAPTATGPTMTKGPDWATCGRMVIVLPRTAAITRIVKEPHCPAGGWCGFASEPITEEVSPEALAVWVVFKNWSHNLSAGATLKVFVRP